MQKITAVLEQETWVPVDAPDEFQAILDRFTAFESLSNGRSTMTEALVRADSADQADVNSAQAATEEPTVSDEHSHQDPGVSKADQGANQVNGKVSWGQWGFLDIAHNDQLLFISNLSGQKADMTVYFDCAKLLLLGLFIHALWYLSL